MQFKITQKKRNAREIFKKLQKKTGNILEMSIVKIQGGLPTCKRNAV
jgi:hypothetical protein